MKIGPSRRHPGQVRGRPRPEGGAGAWPELKRRGRGTSKPRGRDRGGVRTPEYPSGRPAGQIQAQRVGQGQAQDSRERPSPEGGAGSGPSPEGEAGAGTGRRRWSDDEGPRA